MIDNKINNNNKIYYLNFYSYNNQEINNNYKIFLQEINEHKTKEVLDQINHKEVHKLHKLHKIHNRILISIFLIYLMAKEQLFNHL